MAAIKQTLFTGWNIMRFLRFGMGIFFIIQGIQMQNILMSLAGGFFFLTSVANVGCCGAGNCSVPANKQVFDNRQD